jgi:hypothetical protein
MKILSTIFALIIAVQVCIPCSDGDACQSPGGGSVVSVSNHEHSPLEEDFCSPFCICSCCSVKMSQPAPFHFDAFLPDYSDVNFPFIHTSVPSVLQPIWQPPKAA